MTSKEAKKALGALLLLNNEHNKAAAYNKATLSFFKENAGAFPPRYENILLRLDALFIEAKEAEERNKDDGVKASINARVDHYFILAQDYILDLENEEARG